MWDPDKSIHPRNLPKTEELTRLIGDRNTALMLAHEAESRAKLAESSFDPEGVAKNLQYAAQRRAEVAEYDHKLNELNYDPGEY